MREFQNVSNNLAMLPFCILTFCMPILIVQSDIARKDISASKYKTARTLSSTLLDLHGLCHRLGIKDVFNYSLRIFLLHFVAEERGKQEVKILAGQEQAGRGYLEQLLQEPYFLLPFSFGFQLILEKKKRGVEMERVRPILIVKSILKAKADQKRICVKLLK